MVDAAPAVVFVGPTLPVHDCRSVLAAAIRPPARRGDVYRAIEDGFKTVVLIDGEFHGSPSVWQREIIDAMAEGVDVHGASSMGALRAAELHAFGMVGHGKIFEWFRDGVLVADDEVALTYVVTPAGYRPTSEPMVNIRATLARAVPDVLTPGDCEELIAHLRTAHFAERSFEALFAGEPVTKWPVERRTALRRIIADNRIDQKRLDAIAALRAVSVNPPPARRASPIAAAPSLFWKRERVAAWDQAWATPDRDLESMAASLNLPVERLRSTRRAASTQFFLAEWARATSQTLSPNNVHEEVVRRCVLEWAAANGIEHPELEGADLANWIVESGPDRFGYVWYADLEIAVLLKNGQACSGAGPAS